MSAQQQTHARLSVISRTLRQAAYDKHRQTLLELSKIRATVAAEDNPYEVLVPIQVRDAYVVADILDRVTLAVAIARIDEIDQELAQRANEELVQRLKQRETDGHRGLDEALNSGDGSYRP